MNNFGGIKMKNNKRFFFLPLKEKIKVDHMKILLIYFLLKMIIYFIFVLKLKSNKLY